MGKDVIVACDFASAEQTFAFLDRAGTARKKTPNHPNRNLHLRRLRRRSPPALYFVKGGWIFLGEGKNFFSS